MYPSTYVEQYEILLREYSEFLLKELKNLFELYSVLDISLTLDEKLEVKKNYGTGYEAIGFHTAKIDNDRFLALHRQMHISLPIQGQGIYVIIIGGQDVLDWSQTFLLKVGNYKDERYFEKIKITDSLNLFNLFNIARKKMRAEEIIKKEDMVSILCKKGYRFSF